MRILLSVARLLVNQVPVVPQLTEFTASGNLLELVDRLLVQFNYLVGDRSGPYTLGQSLGHSRCQLGSQFLAGVGTK